MEFKTFSQTFYVRNAKAERGTKKAILVRFGDDAVDHWIALSQIDARSEVKANGDKGSLVVSDWLAEQHHWFEETPKGSGSGLPNGSKQTSTLGGPAPDRANVVDMYKRLKSRVPDELIPELDALCKALKGAA
jgi:hypothetical protein